VPHTVRSRVSRTALARLAVLLLAAGLFACRLAERAVEPTPTATLRRPTLAVPTTSRSTPPPAQAPAVYRQNFDNPQHMAGWTLESTQDERAHVQRDLLEGAYRWRLAAMQDVFHWMYPELPAAPPGPDFYYAVTVHVGDAPPDFAYGLLFDVHDGGNFYFYKVNRRGLVGLYQRDGQGFTTLMTDTPVVSLHSEPQAGNRLAVERTAGVVRLMANGETLVETPLPASGGVFGLAAELQAGQAASLTFDDVLLCNRRCE